MMEVGTCLVRSWARRLKPGPFLTFSRSLRGVPDGRSTLQDGTMAGVCRSAEDCPNPAVNWKLRMSYARYFGGTSRNFSSGGEPRKKKKLMPLQERKMIDKCRLHVRGGEGGAGCSSFRKSRQSRHGLADGGNGGRGGDVLLISSAAVWDFSNLHHHLNGTRGGPGSSKKKVGSRGMDKIVQVPVGTVIHVVRGSIPSLEQVPPSREEPIWEEWDTANSQETSIPLLETTLQAKIDERIEYSSSLDLGSGNYAQESGTVYLQDSKLLVQSLDADKQHFLENVGSHTAIEPPCSGSDDGQNTCDEDYYEYDLRGDITEEEEDDSLEQEVQSSVAEFVKVGQSFTVACGGEGGKGNAAMARGRGSEKSLPSFEHEQGRPGSEADLILELKTIADVGLVGAPNAGKSTLLGSLSMAKPTTGNYKFTTLRPNIGMLKYEDFFSLTVADIPGLIDGAHENRGLGHAFLRHIERTKVLAYVIDLAGGIGDDIGPLPWDQYEELVFELEQYQKGLCQRPSILVANKIDEEGALAALEVLRKKVPFLEIYPVCAVLEEGVDALKLGLRELVESSQTNFLPLSRPREF